MSRVSVVLLLSALALACGASTSPQNLATPPTLLAQAGADQAVASGAVVTLDGTASSGPAGAALTYAWAQVSGPPVTLSGASAARPTFTAPAVAAGRPAALLVFSLAVSEASGAVSSPSTVTVTVGPAAPANGAPLASAGPNQSVASGAAVTLDGSASSGAGGALTYAWTQSAGAPVALSAAGSAHPTFTAPGVASGAPAVTLVFTLVVSDASGASAPSTTTVLVNPSGAAVQPPPPGTPPPATGAPLPVGASGAHGKGIRFEVGTFLGLYLVDPAPGEATVQGWVNVTYGAISSGNFIPPANTTVTLNGVPLVRDPPPANGSFWHLDPAGPQPVVGWGGQLVIVATALPPGQTTPDVRTLVLPCAVDVPVASSPDFGAALAARSSVHLSSPSDLTLNLPTSFVALRGDVPQARMYEYDPATRVLGSGLGVTNVPAGPLDLDVPVPATSAAAYLLDLRWPGLALPDGETGGFCGLAKRFTFGR